MNANPHTAAPLMAGDAPAAYRSVLAGTRQRLVIEPWRAVARSTLPGQMN
jgi:hypothetical protein